MQKYIYKFGTSGNVQKSSIYSSAKGYGFIDQSYPHKAAGWVNEVYQQRIKAEKPGTENVSDEKDYIAIRSKVWKEVGEPLGTDKATSGTYYYDFTSEFVVDIEPGNYEITVDLINPIVEQINPINEEQNVNILVNDLIKSTISMSKAKSDYSQKLTTSFETAITGQQIHLKFEVASNATTEEDAQWTEVFVSSVSINRLPEKIAGSKPTIYIASDSTVQSYEPEHYPQAGWGQMLYKYFKGAANMKFTLADGGYLQAKKYELSEINIENRSIGGRSAKSFIEEGKLESILLSIKPGDYLFVQFAHNDATAIRPNRYVSAENFAPYIQKYIDGAKQRGAICVLVTPVPQLKFTDGQCNISFNAYRKVMLDMAEQQGLPLLDLGKAGAELLTSFGEAQSSIFLMKLDEGAYPNYPAGTSDITHFQEFGADKMAGLLVGLIRDIPALSGLTALLSEPQIQSTIPQPPTELKLTSAEDSKVKLKWELIDDAEYYLIYKTRSLKDQDKYTTNYAKNSQPKASEEVLSIDEPLKKVGASISGLFTDKDCEGGFTYTYCITACNAKGESMKSESLQVTVNAALSDVNQAPTGLNAYEVDLTKSSTHSYFSLRFNPTSNATAYRIYRKANNQTDFTLLDNLKDADSLNSYSETKGNCYKFYVVGVLADGSETAPSNIVDLDFTDK